MLAVVMASLSCANEGLTVPGGVPALILSVFLTSPFLLTTTRNGRLHHFLAPKASGFGPPLQVTSKIPSFCIECCCTAPHQGQFIKTVRVLLNSGTFPKRGYKTAVCFGSKLRGLFLSQIEQGTNTARG